MAKANDHVEVSMAKGRPMLSWIGKRPVGRLSALPSQLIEAYGESETGSWSDWPQEYPEGGLILHGDNKEALVSLLAGGFRGKIGLVYIDPPFDSGADYVRSISLRGPHEERIPGQGYTLGEQVQYADIWANDNYLQFMYERLILLRELMTDEGSILLHCDWHRSHQLRCLLDEVFGADHLQNEIVWLRTDPHNDAKKKLGWVHDTIFWYSKGTSPVYNWQAVVEPLSDAALKEYSLVKLEDGSIERYRPELEGAGRRFKLDDCTWKGTDRRFKFVWRGASPSDKRVWPYATPEEMDAAVERGEFYLRTASKGAARCRVSYLDEREGQVLQTIWTECGRMKGGVDYPTEKPAALLTRIIEAFSNPGDIVLDCFSGSGTTPDSAQASGRRWIACDINRGAIQLASKRLMKTIAGQEAAGAVVADGAGLGEANYARPCQLSLTVHRVNNYDLAVRRDEVVDLLAKAVGFTPLTTDPFFDGLMDRALVRIVSTDRPLTPLDLEAIKEEIATRTEEDRDIVCICVGANQAAKDWLEEWNRLRTSGGAVNRISIMELSSDERVGRFFRQEPCVLEVQAEVVQPDSQVKVRIAEFMSPLVVRRLSEVSGVLSPVVRDWRSTVESVAIDPDYNGEVFRAALIDCPEARATYVSGEYQFEADRVGDDIAVKVLDVLGEEALVVVQRPI